MKKKFDTYIDKLGSRRFQVLIMSLALFIVTPRFSDTSLVIVFGIYIGSSTLEKITKR